MTAKVHRKIDAFTLIELLVSISVIFILASLLFSAMKSVRDRTNIAKCASNLRALAGATISYANEHDGYLWSRQDIGNSKYRMADDDKSPVKLLSNYISKEAWICPGAPKTMAIFKNNYTWNVALQFDTQPVATIDNTYLTLLFWDAYQYTLPTMQNANEAVDANGNGKGPSTAKVQTKYHSFATKTNWSYLDGHVETK